MFAAASKPSRDEKICASCASLCLKWRAPMRWSQVRSIERLDLTDFQVIKQGIVMSKVEEPHSYRMPSAACKNKPYGGQFVPETLMQPLEELVAAYDEARRDPVFQQ